MTWAEELKGMMKDIGLAVEDIAQMTDASYPTVRRWIDGTRQPTEAVKEIIRREVQKFKEC